MPIKSFRGLLGDASQDTIFLHTNDGSTGYRIVKFEVMSNIPGQLDHENIVKIYKIPQTDASISGTVDFSDQTLLAAAFNSGDATSNNYPENIVVIFDREIVNQDIHITNKEVSGNSGLINYYIELEVMKLQLDENTVATLKDIRNVAS